MSKIGSQETSYVFTKMVQERNRELIKRIMQDTDLKAKLQLPLDQIVGR